MLESQKKATKKYFQKCKAFSFRFNRETEPELIEHVEKQENITDYFRELVRKDLKNEV